MLPSIATGRHFVMSGLVGGFSLSWATIAGQAASSSARAGVRRRSRRVEVSDGWRRTGGRVRRTRASRGPVSEASVIGPSVAARPDGCAASSARRRRVAWRPAVRPRVGGRGRVRRLARGRLGHRDPSGCGRDRTGDRGRAGRCRADGARRRTAPARAGGAGRRCRHGSGRWRRDVARRRRWPAGPASGRGQAGDQARAQPVDGLVEQRPRIPAALLERIEQGDAGRRVVVR